MRRNVENAVIVMRGPADDSGNRIQPIRCVSRDLPDGFLSCLAHAWEKRAQLSLVERVQMPHGIAEISAVSAAEQLVPDALAEGHRDQEVLRRHALQLLSASSQYRRREMLEHLGAADKVESSIPERQALQVCEDESVSALPADRTRKVDAHDVEPFAEFPRKA